MTCSKTSVFYVDTTDGGRLKVSYVLSDLSDFVVEHPGLENVEKFYSLSKYVHPAE